MQPEEQLINLDESRRIRKLLQAKPGQCYHNAYRVVREVPGYENAEYVEGIAITPTFAVVEHGWIERNGEIIDPTFCRAGVVYFPGLRFLGSHGLTQALALPRRATDTDLPIFGRLGWRGSHSPEFKRARKDAFSYLAAQLEEC